jgi:hypothetical protein
VRSLEGATASIAAFCVSPSLSCRLRSALVCTRNTPLGGSSRVSTTGLQSRCCPPSLSCCGAQLIASLKEKRRHVYHFINEFSQRSCVFSATSSLRYTRGFILCMSSHALIHMYRTLAQRLSDVKKLSVETVGPTALARVQSNVDDPRLTVVESTTLFPRFLSTVGSVDCLEHWAAGTTRSITDTRSASPLALLSA